MNPLVTHSPGDMVSPSTMCPARCRLESPLTCTPGPVDFQLQTHITMSQQKKQALWGIYSKQHTRGNVANPAGCSPRSLEDSEGSRNAGLAISTRFFVVFNRSVWYGGAEDSAAWSVRS